MYSATLRFKEAAMLDENSGDVLKEIARINLQHFHDFDAAIDATTAIITNHTILIHICELKRIQEMGISKRLLMIMDV